MRLRVLSRGDYAECGGPVPAAVKPVFVNLLLAKAAPQKARLKEAVALAKAVARACGRAPGNVHIFYDPPAAGRAAFGGELLEKKNATFAEGKGVRS